MSSPNTDLSGLRKAVSDWDPYGYVRRKVRKSDRNFGELRRAMNQARISTPYDLYVARIVVYSAFAAVMGIVMGVALTYFLTASGFFAGGPYVSLPPGIGGFVEPYKIYLAGAALSAVIAAALSVSTAASLYLYPGSLADRRGQKIDMELPHAIVYMYALSYGGTNMIKIIESLAGEKETYGEVSNEFSYVRRDTEYFGSEFHTSLRKLYEITPSENLKTFIDDLLGVIESGGDITVFLETQGEKYLSEAEDAQEESLETLSIVSEMYLTLFLVAPILVVVMLLVVGLMGGSDLTPLYAIVYAVLPAGMVGFVVLLDFIEESSPSGGVLESEKRRTGTDRQKPIPEGELADRYLKRKRMVRLKRALRHPFERVGKRPLTTLAVTLPLTVVWLWYVSSTGTVSLAGMWENPVDTTSYAVVVPLLILLTPLSVFHEIKKWRQNKIINRFPDKLNSIADANKMGLSFTESLRQTSEASTGFLAEELETTYNDIRWNADTDYALAKFANRVDVPEITRTVKLIIEARAATGEVHQVLKIAANDAKARLDLRKKRNLQASQHLSVILLGFFVYLFILLTLDRAFIQPISVEIGSAAVDASEIQGGAVPIDEIPVNEYRMLFFHSVVVQAIGNGVIAGKIGDDKVLSGLKYSIAFLIIGTLAFVFLV